MHIVFKDIYIYIYLFTNRNKKNPDRNPVRLAHVSYNVLAVKGFQVYVPKWC